MKIIIKRINIKKANISNSEIIKFFNFLLQYLKLSKKLRNFELSLVITNNRMIKSINRKYRKKNKSTDVLAFESVFFPLFGEIILSIDKIKENAKYYKVKFKEEFFKILAHGFLHLLGFDHEKSKKDLLLMSIFENYIVYRFLRYEKRK